MNLIHYINYWSVFMNKEITPELTIINQDEEHFVDETISEIEKRINTPYQPRNRAERRALEKASRQTKKKRKIYIDSIKEATEKLAYIDTIEKVRALNEKIKEEGEKENEATTENN